VLVPDFVVPVCYLQWQALNIIRLSIIYLFIMKLFTNFTKGTKCLCVYHMLKICFRLSMLQFAGYKQVAGILYAFWQSTASVELSFYQCNGFIAVTETLHHVVCCVCRWTAGNGPSFSTRIQPNQLRLVKRWLWVAAASLFHHYSACTLSVRSSACYQ